MVAIGVAHVALLWSGDIVAAYGLLTAASPGWSWRGRRSAWRRRPWSAPCSARPSGRSRGSRRARTAPLPSIAVADPVTAAVLRLGRVGGRHLDQLAGQRRRCGRARGVGGPAPDPGRPAAHRRLLGRVAVAGLVTAVLAGLPLALATVGVWRPGLGHAAARGVPAHPGRVRGRAGLRGGVRAAGRTAPARTAGPGGAGAAACGQRSLSCYLGQSVLFVALLPAWTLGLGARLAVAQAALLAVGVWLVMLLVAVVVGARRPPRPGGDPAAPPHLRPVYRRPGPAPSPPAPPSPPAGRRA